MSNPRIAILHYSAPPVVGGVEAVIQAHVGLFASAGYAVQVIAGRGEPGHFPPGVEFVSLPEIDSQHPEIIEISAALERGEVPGKFAEMAAAIAVALEPVVRHVDVLFVHNVFSKHFNLPLTAALYNLIEDGAVNRCIAWCHDFTWTSPSSGSKVHPGYPWDLLRTQREDVTYVVVSRSRQRELARLFSCPLDQIKVIYNGVDPVEILGLSPQGLDHVQRLGLLESELNLLMPVRVTKAKNIEFALQVASALKERIANFRLVLTGPPDPHDPGSMVYYRFLRDLRKELDVEEQMRFVYEAGPHPDQPSHIEVPVVGDLLRLSDVMFMPSHREGFGMPVLEAGLAGVPVVARNVPAASEIAGGEATIFTEDQDPGEVAELIFHVVETNPVARLRREIRRNYTWEAIFQRDILPLLEGKT